MSLSVRRAETEEALRIFRATAADYRAATVSTAGRGRIIVSASRLGSGDIVQIRRQSYYLRQISLAEAFTDIIIACKFSDALPAPIEIVSKLIGAAESSASGNWDARKRALAQYHNIEWVKFSGNGVHRRFVEVRNIIAHSLGRLSQGRLSDYNMKKDFEGKLGIYVRNSSLDITPAGIRIMENHVLDYINWLDGASR